MANKQLDFTEGNIFKQLIFFSSPIFFTNLLQTSYQVVDSLWVGNLLGANALGAIAVSSTVIFTILSFIIGINNSSLTVLSQHKGAGDKEGLKASLNAFVVVLGFLTLMVGIIGYFSSPAILKWMGTPDDMLPLGVTYLQINFLGILFLFGYNFIATVLRALGDSKTPVRFVIIAVILNAVLDPLLISVFNLGIAGAAYATIISEGAAFIYGLVYSLFKVKVPFTIPALPSKKDMKRIFKFGLPSGLSMIVISGGSMAIMTVVTSFGEDVVAGFGAAQRLDNLIMLPAMTLGTAVNSMAGQNIGAGLWERVNKIAKNGLLLILTVTFFISTFVFFTAQFLISMFVQDPETVAFGKTYVKWIAFFYPFLGINFVLNGIVRASGAMFQVFILNVISFWVLRFPLTYLVSNWIGEEGIALGMGISLIISSIIAICYYRYGGWKKIKIVSS